MLKFLTIFSGYCGRIPLNFSRASLLLENIRIVLIETSHSGNIGSAARAMKTMGLTQLCLVSPKSVDEQSYALSAGAEDIVKMLGLSIVLMKPSIIALW